MLASPVHLSWLQLVLWTFGIAFFGVFFAVPLRKVAPARAGAH